MVTRQEDLGGLAGEQAERRHVADGVAGEKCGEGLRAREASRGAGMHRRQHSARTTKRMPASAEDRDEAPADAADAVDDLSGAGALDGVGEKRSARESSHQRDQTGGPGTHGAYGLRSPVSGLRSSVRRGLQDRRLKPEAHADCYAPNGWMKNRISEISST